MAVFPDHSPAGSRGLERKTVRRSEPVARCIRRKGVSQTGQPNHRHHRAGRRKAEAASTDGSVASRAVELHPIPIRPQHAARSRRPSSFRRSSADEAETGHDGRDECDRRPPGRPQAPSRSPGPRVARRRRCCVMHQDPSGRRCWSAAAGFGVAAPAGREPRRRPRSVTTVASLAPRGGYAGFAGRRRRARKRKASWGMTAHTTSPSRGYARRATPADGGARTCIASDLPRRRAAGRRRQAGGISWEPAAGCDHVPCPTCVRPPTRQRRTRRRHPNKKATADDRISSPRIPCPIDGRSTRSPSCHPGRALRPMRHRQPVPLILLPFHPAS
jgi:hypothetical protein